MKAVKLIALVIGMAATGLTGVYAQSKKEKIEILTRKNDSLEKVLASKNEIQIILQVKLARLQGAAGAYNEQIRRLENKDDSLKELLITGRATIDAQASKIAQLNQDINGLQVQQKEWSGKNAALASEIDSLKQKPVTAATPVKAAKQTDSPKEEPRNGNTVSGSKPDAAVKNQN